MIRLFLTDIDGCLSEPYTVFDLEAFAVLRDWIRASGEDETLPCIGICSGRSYGYVEAVAQALGIVGPSLFESGGGRLDLPAARIRWSSALTGEVEAQLDAVRAFFHREIMPRGGFSFDFGKRAQAGVVCLDPESLAVAVNDTRSYVGEFLPDLMVADTHVSIDIVPSALSKEVAVREVAAEEGLSLDEIAFIGDTRGDLGALLAVGTSFAPANAQPIIREAVDIVTEGAVLQGVLEAYRWCVAHNRRLVNAA
jgi:3-deoxy-D-manno-octulosonate 8-phosphate phosphatase KdsC-like HAD superfamily phosphatase